MHIWAVGGGKGGTGKSLVAHGLGLALAGRGAQVILVDADYGGPNQHTYCGLRQPATSLADFFERKLPLESLILDTPVPRLRLIPGNINTPNTDGITWAQKQKLFRHLRLLPAEHVILDLGAGSQYDTLDTFLLADYQIGVIMPDRLSIENFYLFLKNLKFRQVGNILSALGLKEQAAQIWRNRAEHGIGNTRDLLQYLQERSANLAERLSRDQGRLFLHLIVNQVREYRQIELGLAVKSSIQKYFQIQAGLAGSIRHDKELWQSFGQEHPSPNQERSVAVHLALEGILASILATQPAEVH